MRGCWIGAQVCEAGGRAMRARSPGLTTHSARMPSSGVLTLLPSPPSFWAPCLRLRSLSLRGCQLRGLPQGLQLSRLTALDIAGNAFGNPGFLTGGSAHLPTHHVLVVEKPPCIHASTTCLLKREMYAASWLPGCPAGTGVHALPHLRLP